MIYTDMLKKLQMVQLATISGNEPRIRPMTMIWWQDKYWFATSSGDPKVAQLDANPQAEWCLLLPQDGCTGYLKGRGSMLKVSDPALRKAVADFAGFIYDYWKDASDPDYTLYEMQLSSLRLMRPGAMFAEDITPQSQSKRP